MVKIMILLTAFPFLTSPNLPMDRDKLSKGGELSSDVDLSTKLKSPLRGDLEGSNKWDQLI